MNAKEILKRASSQKRGRGDKIKVKGNTDQAIDAAEMSLLHCVPSWERAGRATCCVWWDTTKCVLAIGPRFGEPMVRGALVFPHQRVPL